MNRWTSSILLAIAGLWPALAAAQGPWTAPGVQQAGFHQGMMPPPRPAQPDAWHGPAANDVVAQLVPGGIDPHYDYDSGLDLLVRESLARSWIRVDYLMWNMSGGDDTLLGAPTTSTADLSGQDRFNLLSAIDPITGPRPQTAAIVSKLDGKDWNTLNGVRGTIGIPTMEGTFEANLWGIQRNQETIVVNPLVYPGFGIPTELIGAVTLLNNGVPSSTAMILFSENYRARLSADLWGTEGNWVFKPFTPNVGMEVSPILGFRYVRLNDGLSITGADVPDPINDPTTVLNHVIQSEATNNVFGPQVGLRFNSAIGKRVDIGADTKFVFGINRIKESLHTEQIFTADEAPVSQRRTDTEFAPVFNLALYGKLHLTHAFDLYVGYDLLLGGGFSRSYDNIRYNLPPDPSAGSDITLSSHLTKFMAHGLSVGGELRFR